MSTQNSQFTSDYTQAPACKLLATHCCICASPLLDAKSVESGIGPVCAKKYGFNIKVSDEARQEANKIVYEIAARQEGPEVGPLCVRLRELGFEKLADRILERVAPIAIHQMGDKLWVSTPYTDAVVSDMRGIPGRQWKKLAKVNEIPNTLESKRALWEVLAKHFNGRLARGPKGPFVVKPWKTEAA